MWLIKLTEKHLIKIFREREMKTYYYTSQTTHYEPYLAHHGVKGMKWGVRHDAKKDAKEYRKAKMATGEGAGNRRKKIKTAVAKKKSQSSDYATAFDYYNDHYSGNDYSYSKQDTRKHNRQQAYRTGKKAVKTAVAVSGGIYSLAVLTGREDQLIQSVNRGIDAVARVAKRN